MKAALVVGGLAVVAYVAYRYFNASATAGAGSRLAQKIANANVATFNTGGK